MRYHTTAKGNIPFTAEEEAQRDAEEASYVVKQAALAATEYQRQRAAEYPSIADQLDLLYHGGIDGWKASIQTVKDKYPKG